MSVRKSLPKLLLFVFLLGAAAGSQPALAQESPANSPQTTQAPEDQTNLDTQLYLLVATNEAVKDPAVPALLDPIVRRLRSSLPFRNYRLAATLINRVKNDGRLNLRWIGGPLSASAAVSAAVPGFNEFKIGNVKLVAGEGGRQLVRMDGFGFGVRIPVTTGVASNGSPVQITNYESTGLNTDISFREGEPVIVGTLNIGPSGDAIILVMSANRAPR